MALNLDHPYQMDTTPTDYERQAGVKPQAFNSYLDSNGNMKSQYSVDPSQSGAFAQMKGIASSADLSPWAKMQMEQNDNSTAHQRDQTNAQGMGANDQAMSQLMTTGGGANSGAAAFLASQGARTSVMANQNIGAQQQTNALGIQSQDAQNKQTLLGQVANTETGAQAANAHTAQQDTTNANLFSANQYHERMAAWGAATAADAQNSAAQAGGGKGK